MKTSEITWYEDGYFAEWWENDSIKPVDRHFEHMTLEECIRIAQSNRLLLIIQPQYQEQCIFIDFTETG